MSKNVIRVTPMTTGIAARTRVNRNLSSNSASTLSYRAIAACSRGLFAVAYVDVLVPGPRPVLVPGTDVEVLDSLAQPPDALREGEQRRGQVLHQDVLKL